ncbi:MAG: hypothetical protein JWN34_101 [Bryobacterales bacterium]|nr:hypothetical protein [Bryobacterales bacterium]
MKARPTCNPMTAQACSAAPQIVQIRLLSRDNQKPQRRRLAPREAISQVDASVTAIAGH